VIYLHEKEKQRRNNYTAAKSGPRAAILDRFFVKVMSYEMEHSFLRNDLN